MDEKGDALVKRALNYEGAANFAEALERDTTQVKIIDNVEVDGNGFQSGKRDALHPAVTDIPDAQVRKSWKFQ